MAPELYHPVFLGVVGFFILCYIVRFATSSDYRYQIEDSSQNIIVAFLLCMILVIWLGNRPISYIFGDTTNYAMVYENADLTRYQIEEESQFHLNSEFVWNFIQRTCQYLGCDVHIFLTIIEFGYVFSVFWAMKRFVPTNPLFGILIAFSSLMFFTFGTNGIRNGLGCHILLLAISFYLDERWLIAGVMTFLALGTHFSVVLPIMAIIVSRYAIKNYRIAVSVWLVALVLSAVAGSQLEILANIFQMDDRFSKYISGADMEEFENIGFRVDFIIYSLPPILLAWHVLIKKGIKDEWYLTLSSAYCLCNAAWLLIIRAAYTNRFAYLSWFLYPVLIAYPVINLPIWRDQDKRIAITLIAYYGFTLFMEGFVWKSLW